MRLAVDPGQTTGVAWRTTGGNLEGIEWSGNQIVAVLDAYHTAHGISELVVERFRSRPGPAVNLSAPETIGRILGWADMHGIAVVLQDPSPVKRTVPKDRLREENGWLVGKPHARDAVRHLIYRESAITV